ncbi:MAG: replication factor C small subunit, partial [Edafosvirus sp.]
ASARELYKENFPVMVLEINASEERGIDVVRTRINTFVTSKNVFYGDDYKNIFKLVILDEADAMTDDAQAILRRVIEKYTENARFCLICNYIKKINPALQSRCTCFRFAPLDEKQIKIKMESIIEKENINITTDAINIIVKRANGDMRKVLNVLQTTNMSYDIIDEKAINSCLGYPQKEFIDNIVKHLVTKSFEQTYKLIDEYRREHGFSLMDIINEVYGIILNNLINDGKNIYIQKMDEKKLIIILDRLRDIEYNLSVCTSELIQTSAFIGIFKHL